jgi:hypothetical protein
VLWQAYDWLPGGQFKFPFYFVIIKPMPVLLASLLNQWFGFEGLNKMKISSFFGGL